MLTVPEPVGLLTDDAPDAVLDVHLIAAEGTIRTGAGARLARGISGTSVVGGRF
jgi:hypothetical protein